MPEGDFSQQDLVDWARKQGAEGDTHDEPGVSAAGLDSPGEEGDEEGEGDEPQAHEVMEDVAKAIERLQGLELPDDSKLAKRFDKLRDQVADVGEELSKLAEDVEDEASELAEAAADEDEDEEDDGEEGDGEDDDEAEDDEAEED